MTDTTTDNIHKFLDHDDDTPIVNQEVDALIDALDRLSKDD
jgi:hypothetical protein